MFGYGCIVALVFFFKRTNINCKSLGNQNNKGKGNVIKMLVYGLHYCESNNVLTNNGSLFI